MKISHFLLFTFALCFLIFRNLLSFFASFCKVKGNKIRKVVLENTLWKSFLLVFVLTENLVSVSRVVLVYSKDKKLGADELAFLYTPFISSNTESENYLSIQKI